MATPPSPTMTTASNVLWFVPNMIGYTRVLMTLSGFFIMTAFPERWISGILLYLGSFVGDLVDGMVARQLHQTSSFGGVLDMITDRCSTTGLLYVLAAEYTAMDEELPLPFFRLTFLALLLLDIASHWCQMYSSLSVGAHHKSEAGNAGKNVLVRWFYAYYWFFGYLCVGAEFTYILLYVRRHLDAVEAYSFLLSNVLNTVLAICIPGCIAKQCVNVMQLTSACHTIAQYDADQRNKQVGSTSKNN
jgi:CDP-diacylglycerol--inositol 3-phosphatidyltransferase